MDGPLKMRRTAPERATRVRRVWWEIIRELPSDDVRAALLQALADIDEHWDKEHEEDGIPEDLDIPVDEYLMHLVQRSRQLRPAETFE
jgi:hypothetical protein